MAQRLATTRYVPPGVYIGQLIKPSPGNLNLDARKCCYIGKGDRLALGKNLGIRRSFVYREPINFTVSSPYRATLQYPANGDKAAPIRLFKSDGTEVRVDQWDFIETIDGYTMIEMSNDAFDSTANYYFDYQSTSREVLDPIPVEDLRLVQYVSNIQDQIQYKEYVDFFIPAEITEPIPDPTNTNPDPSVDAPVAAVANVGTGSFALNVGNSYQHNYNRFYRLTVTNSAGITPNRTAVLEWSAEPISGGNDSLPPTPYFTSATKPTFTLNEAVPSSLTGINLELGIRINAAFGAGNYAIGDNFYVSANGPGLIESDIRYVNTNQYVEYGDVEPAAGNTGTGSIDHDEDTNYTGVYNIHYYLKCIAAVGVTPNRTATLVWASAGELGAGGQFILDETNPATLVQPLSNGTRIVLSFGAANFAVADEFDFEVKAPRILYEAKDNRDYILQISSATNPSSEVGMLVGTYNVNTPEGGFGSYEATADKVIGIDLQTGRFQLPDNVVLVARNMFKHALVGGLGNLNAADDMHTFSIAVSNLMNWSLTKKVTEEVGITKIVTDTNGTVTGFPGTPYIILGNVPSFGTVEISNSLGVPISFVEVEDSAFVYFPTNPADNLTVNYEYVGEEPNPSELYYFTGLFLRPADYYNVPILVLTRDDGRRLLAPSTTNNHLYMMNEIHFDHSNEAAYYTQVKDADGDGAYTDSDFKEALLATEKVEDISDLIVLSNYSSWGDALSINVKANDPFEKREQICWFGCPIGTPIGNDVTPNSLVFLAKKTLQVFGNSPAHGNRVLVAPTYCKRDVVLFDNSTTTVTLDGSFVAGALAALNSSFTDPAVSVLRKALIFKEIQTYTVPENRILGAANTIYFTDQGAGSYRVEEDVTVDDTAPEFLQISLRNQTQYVTKVIRRELEKALIAQIVPSGEAGEALIRATLSSLLTGLLGKGLIGDYQDATGAARAFDPNLDIEVFRDENDLTLYHFYYCFFTRNIIKRCWGLFSVNSNDFGLGKA